MQSINKLLELLVSLSIAGSTVVVCILLLRLVSPGVLPTKWRYAIGKMAVGFYLLPIALILQWILPFLIPKQPTTVSMTVLPSSVQQTLFDLNIMGSPELKLSADVALIFLSIWGIGALAFAIWQVYCYRRFIKKLQQTCSSVPENSEAAQQLTLLKEVFGIKSKVRLAYSTAVRSPVLVGLWKPTIYLPMEIIANMDICMVIRHELVHLKQNDLWVKAFTLAASTLHWFNPLVHILRKDIHMWSELTCDEEVVKEMSYAERKRYGETILNVMIGSRGIPVRFCVSLSGNGKLLKRRLTMMLNVKKMKKRTLVLTTAALISVGGIGTATSVWASSNTPTIDEKAPETLAKLEYTIGNSDFIKEVEETPIAKTVHEEFVEIITDFSDFHHGEAKLIAVRPSNESKFSAEEWQEILKMIENGEIYWEEKASD